MKKIHFLVSVLLSCSFVFFGCKKTESELTTVIQNRSSEDVFIAFIQDSTSGFQPVQDTILVKAFSEYQVYGRTAIGGTDQFSKCAGFIDTLKLTIANGTINLNKSLLADSNWVFEVQGTKKKVTQCECRFYIDSTDFQ
jgi:hypothetical protein